MRGDAGHIRSHHIGLDAIVLRLAVAVIAAIAADDQACTATLNEHVEDRLDEILKIMWLPVDRHLLAESRGARPLIGEGVRGDRANGHVDSTIGRR
jgi:hypothetical protein